MIENQHLFPVLLFVILVTSYVTYKPFKTGKNGEKTSKVEIFTNREKLNFTNTAPGFSTWNRSHVFAFIHVGKTGGTSFDLTMQPRVVKITHFGRLWKRFPYFFNINVYSISNNFTFNFTKSTENTLLKT